MRRDRLLLAEPGSQEETGALTSGVEIKVVYERFVRWKRWIKIHVPWLSSLYSRFCVCPHERSRYCWLWLSETSLMKLAQFLFHSSVGHSSFLS